MKAFTSNQVGRTFVVKLEQGEDIIESIEALIAEQGIENAVVLSGIATIDRSVLHVVTTLGYPFDYEMREETDKPLEVASIDGFICDGEPHLHCVLADTCQVYAGHMHKGCRVLYLCEIVIQELLGLSIERRLNEHGANHIYAKSSAKNSLQK